MWKAPAAEIAVDGRDDDGGARQSGCSSKQDADSARPPCTNKTQPKLDAKQKTQLREAKQLFKEGILTKAEFDNEVMLSMQGAAKALGGKEEVVESIQQKSYAEAESQGAAEALGGKEVVAESIQEQYLEFSRSVDAKAESLTQLMHSAGAMQSHTPPMEASVQESGQRNKPASSMNTAIETPTYESMGYKCPTCSRDFSGTHPKARNSCMSRHVKKCARDQDGEGGEGSEGASKTAGGRGGKGGALCPPISHKDTLGGTRPAIEQTNEQTDEQPVEQTVAEHTGNLNLSSAADAKNIAGIGTEGGGNDAAGNGWWVRGSEYLGRRVRRAVNDDTGEIIGVLLLLMF